jgi:hypothetical protein
MLYPTRNPDRQCIDLSAFWAFKPDSLMQGERGVRSSGLPDSRPISVPVSWNDLFENLRSTRLEMCAFKTAQGITRMGSTIKGSSPETVVPKWKLINCGNF